MGTFYEQLMFVLKGSDKVDFVLCKDSSFVYLTWRHSMKSVIIFIISSLLSACSFIEHDSANTNVITQDGVIRITWVQPQNYTDIQTAHQNQAEFSMQIFNELTKRLNQQAKKILKHDEILTLEVTNLDLAGDIQSLEHATSQRIRQVNGLYPPSMNFNYQLRNNNQIILSGEAHLQDLHFLAGIHDKAEKPLVHEVALLTHWFNHKIAPLVAGAHQSSF